MSELPVIEVVAAMIRRDNGLLICQRPEGKAEASHWEFPGGKIEPGETGPEALIRECREELALSLTVRELFSTIETRLPDRILRIHFYWADAEGQTPRCLEHQALRWTGLDELDRFSFCPSDLQIVRKLLREGMR